MTVEEIQKEIECWASRPTWFSSHPSDVKEFRKAVSNLKKIRNIPSQQEIEEAIYGRVKDLPVMLGTPKNIEEACREFAEKIFSKL